MTKTAATSSILALDVGAKRIGVARASLASKLPSTHGVINNDKDVMDSIKQLIMEEQSVALVVGLPRGLDGQETAQTKQVRQFVDELKTVIEIPIHFQDESLTSVKAQDQLKTKAVLYNKGAVDELAASYILDDWLAHHGEDYEP